MNEDIQKRTVQNNREENRCDQRYENAGIIDKYNYAEWIDE